MTKNQENIINKLTDIEVGLRQILLQIRIENEDGKQFDYCTSAKLGNLSSNISSISKKIEKIVFQD